MWISGKSNRFFVQLARFTIMYKDFVELWCPHDGGRAGAREVSGAPDREQTLILSNCGAGQTPQPGVRMSELLAEC